MFRRVRAALSALIAVSSFGVLPSAGHAQTYPSQPVTLVVSSAAGGIVDTVARLMAAELTTSLKVPVLVEPRAGPAASWPPRTSSRPRTATRCCSPHRARPDAGAAPQPPYDPIKDFLPISHIALSANIIAVLPSFPANTSKNWSRWCANPASIRTAPSATRPGAHRRRAAQARGEARMAHVPYKAARAAGRSAGRPRADHCRHGRCRT
jgi:tripartite-type tricarboxylate transporter receptor subunit TctC